MRHHATFGAFLCIHFIASITLVSGQTLTETITDDDIPIVGISNFKPICDGDTGDVEGQAPDECKARKRVRAAMEVDGLVRGKLSKFDGGDNYARFVFIWRCSGKKPAKRILTVSASLVPLPVGSGGAAEHKGSALECA